MRIFVGNPISKTIEYGNSIYNINNSFDYRLA